MNANPHRLTTQITASLALLAFLGAATAASIAFMASSRIDRTAIAKQEAFVAQGIADQVKAVPHDQESVTIWDDAVERTRAGDKQWMVENLGEWMYSYFGHDRTYVIDHKGKLVHAMRDGDTVVPSSFSGDRDAVAGIVSKLRGRLAAASIGRSGFPAREEAFHSETALVNQRPAVVSVRPIVPSTDRMTLPAGSEYFHASIKFLDRKAVVAVGTYSKLSGMHYRTTPSSAGQEAYVPLMATNGKPLGYFAWTPERPGRTLMMQIAPAVAFASLIAAGIGIFLYWRLRRASIELQDSESRALHLAFHDTLTGLPNRALFNEKLISALERVKAGEGEAALLFLDLDRFKNVNDTLGHRAGDDLLTHAAERLCQEAGATATVARISGDEFAVLIEGERVRGYAEDLAGRMVGALARPFFLEGESIYIGVSIGIAHAPESSTEREDLLRKADIALYESKKRGRGCFISFSSNMDEIVKQRREIEADLREALDKGGNLRLAYQPLHTHDGAVTGAEALLRWNHPVHNAISPPFLISIAEDAGLIMQLGDWILKEACRMVAEIDIPWIAINVSSVQLRDENFADRCLSIIRQVGVAPERIQIEITESVLIENPELTAATFRNFRKNGIQVAIDDFGTGYSSMSYLQDFPVDRLKIDRSFVNALSEGTKGKAIVAAMMEMARALKLDVTAEGVETVDQRETLRGFGCREMQGYLFSVPLESDQFMMMIEDKSPMSLTA
jgi:diguanylate cyclase (GGDEF)-like protein